MRSARCAAVSLAVERGLPGNLYRPNASPRAPQEAKQRPQGLAIIHLFLKPIMIRTVEPRRDSSVSVRYVDTSGTPVRSPRAPVSQPAASQQPRALIFTSPALRPLSPWHHSRGALARRHDSAAHLFGPPPDTTRCLRVALAKVSR